MPHIKMPPPEDNMGFKDLVDLVALYRKELMSVLSSLDSENISVVDGDLTELTNIPRTVVTETLYAEYGNIAELTVDRLSTARFAQNYLDSDTSDVNYINIQGEVISFITAETDGTSTEQLTNRNGDNLYWTDDTNTGITTDVTSHPITIYQYDELTKLKLEFVTRDGEYAPVLTLGAGTGVDDDRKGFIWKDTNGLTLEYVDTNSLSKKIHITDDGINFVNTGYNTLVGDGEFVVKSEPQCKIWTSESQPASTDAFPGDIWIKERPEYVDGTYLEISDEITAPSATTGKAKIYVETSGSLKIKFGDGTVKNFNLST